MRKKFSLEVPHQVTRHAVASACIRQALPAVNYNRQLFYQSQHKLGKFMFKNHYNCDTHLT
jgi:hypothetical protein